MRNLIPTTPSLSLACDFRNDGSCADLTSLSFNFLLISCTLMLVCGCYLTFLFLFFSHTQLLCHFFAFEFV